MSGRRIEELPSGSVVVAGRSREGPILMGRATNKGARFTVGNVSRPGFWRNWGVWGDRSPRSAIRGRGAGRGIVRSAMAAADGAGGRDHPRGVDWVYRLGAVVDLCLASGTD